MCSSDLEIDEISKVAKGVTFTVIAVIALIFVFKVIPGSRFFIFYMWAVGIVLLSISRLIIHKIELRLLKKGIGTKRVVIFGGNQLGQDVAERILLNPSLRLTYVGTLDDNAPERIHFHLRERFNHLGKFDNFKQVLKTENIREIFVTEYIHDKPFFDDLVHFCEQEKIELNLLSDLSSFMAGTLNVRDFDGVPFIVHKEFPNKPIQKMMKRFFDIFASY